MIIIRLRDGSEWFKANWVFRQLASDIQRLVPPPSDLAVFELERAEAFGGLYLDSLEPDLSKELLRMMRVAIHNRLQGEMTEWRNLRPEDSKGQKMYLGALEELIRLTEADKDRL